MSRHIRSATHDRPAEFIKLRCRKKVVGTTLLIACPWPSDHFHNEGLFKLNNTAEARYASQ
jgi:hypothetical protein